MLTVNDLIQLLGDEIVTLEERRKSLATEIHEIEREVSERRAALRIIEMKTQAARTAQAPPLARPQPESGKSQRAAAFELLEGVYPRGIAAKNLLITMQDAGYRSLTINTLSSLLSVAKKGRQIKHEGGLYYRVPPTRAADEAPEAKEASEGSPAAATSAGSLNLLMGKNEHAAA